MSATPPTAAELYATRRERAQGEAERLDRLGFWLANARLALALGAVAIPVLGWMGKTGGWGWPAFGAFAVLFLLAAVFHDRVLGRERRARLREKINAWGLARLQCRWSELPSRGDAYREADHPYAVDLDLFGEASLFQLADATATKLGERTLVRWLKAPAHLPEARARQQAVQALAPRLDWREDLETEGRVLAEEKPDLEKLLAWAERGPILAHVGWWLAAALALPATSVGLWTARELGLIAPRLWLVPLLAQLGLVLFTRRRVREAYERAAKTGEKLSRFDRVFEVLERLEPTGERLARVQESLRRSGATPSRELSRLVRVLSFLQLREQPLFHLPANLVLLWDLQWTLALERWRRRCASLVPAWLEALGECEALSSLARVSFENPEWAFPEIASEGPTLVAEALGHPLLPRERRVANDVALPGPGSVLVVTGSNMSGKTTLLRALGTNAALALAGGPVCARRMSVSPLEVHSSMRVSDSLAQGLSLFYAEVQRLKSVLDASRRGPTLFLLDEVLHGTNTAERQLASLAVAKQLVAAGAIGAIATHDLGLTALERETAGKARNVHFTDLIQDGEMTFDYRLRPGVVTTTNALALLKRAGIDVEVPARPAAEQT